MLHIQVKFLQLVTFEAVLGHNLPTDCDRD